MTSSQTAGTVRVSDMTEPLVIVYTSNRYREALEPYRDHLGPVVAVTSDLAKLLGLKWERPEKQRRLFE